MLKGCEKRVVHVKNPENSLFEEAYFFLKQEHCAELFPPTELWREAEKIVNNSLLEKPSGETNEQKSFSFRLRCLLCFAAGAFVGIFGMLVINSL